MSASQSACEQKSVEESFVVVIANQNISWVGKQYCSKGKGIGEKLNSIYMRVPYIGASQSADEVLYAKDAVAALNCSKGLWESFHPLVIAKNRYKLPLKGKSIYSI